MAEIKNNKTFADEEVVIEDAYDNGVYELGVMNRINDISALTEQREKDYALLSSYVQGNADIDLSNLKISEDLHNVVVQLEKIKEEMKAEMNFEKFGDAIVSSAESSFQAGRESAVETLQTMIDPLTAAVLALQDSVLTKMGIPEVPVIGNIQQIIVKIGEIGRVVSRLSSEDRENAKKAAKKEAEESGGNMVERLYEDSIVDKIVTELRNTFWEVLELLQKIIACIEPFLLMMLLEKLKPVIDYFGLAVGEIYGIAENAYTVGKMLIFNQAKLLDLFAEAIRSKIEDLWDIVRYFIHGGELPNDAMISAIAKDIVCCDFDIQAKQLDVALIQSNQQLYSEKNTLEELKDRYKKDYGNKGKFAFSISQLKAINVDIPMKIFGLENIVIPKNGERIQDFKKNFQKNFDAAYEKLVSENLAKMAEIKKEKTTLAAPTQEAT